MQRIALVLAILCSTVVATAQDNELEQLKQEVAELRQIVSELRSRVEQLEGKQTAPQASQTKSKSESTFYETLPYSLGKVIPKRRAIQQHSFTIKSLTVRRNKLFGQYELIYEIALQNYSNSPWNPYRDQYLLSTQDTDIKGSPSATTTLAKGQRKTIEVIFKTKTFKPEEVRLKIESKDTNNQGDAEFKIEIK